jgi:acylglycerol lipase
MFSQKHTPIKYGFDPSTPPTPPTSVPEGLPSGRFRPSSDNRLWLFCRIWEPENEEEVKATLIICHGTVDHSGFYQELASSLVKHGIAVFAQDMRGWGLSDGESMYMNKIDSFVEDVDCLYEEIHKWPKYTKVENRFILGKSIGGIIAAYTIIRYPSKYSGMIGLSGAYQAHPSHEVSPTLGSIVTAINLFAPKFPLRQIFDPKLIVHDETALQKWYDDPLCSKDRIRAGYAVEAMRCRKELPTLMEDVDIPMLMMIGSDDQVVSLEGLEMMTRRGKRKDSKIKVYQGGCHNLLAEPTLKDEVIAAIKTWILDHVELKKSAVDTTT